MRSFLIVAGVGAFVVVSACGGAPDDPLIGDDGSVTSDSSSGDAGGDALPPGDSGTCSVTCATIPDGFRPVRLADGKASCPANWTSTPVVGSPVAGDGTCTCNCNVTQAPSCEGGMITRYGDQTANASCTTPASSIIATSACTYLGGYLQLYYSHYLVTPPPSQGGTCEFDSAADTSKVTSTSGLMCEPPTNCAGEICNGGAVCVAQDGDVACPSGFATKTLVGQSATATCGACTGACNAKTTCNGKLALYSDQNCTQGEVDESADGACDMNASVDAYVDYAIFTPSPTTPTCDGTPTPPVPVASLTSPTTVCCH
jgi:hypothetical protein